MKDPELENELKEIMSMSSVKKRAYLITFRFLLAVNNKYFFFTISFLPGFIFCYLSDVAILYLIIHCFFWYSFSDRFVKEDEIEKDNIDFRIIIYEIKKSLNKNP